MPRQVQCARSRQPRQVQGQHVGEGSSVNRESDDAPPSFVAPASHTSQQMTSATYKARCPTVPGKLALHCSCLKYDKDTSTRIDLRRCYRSCGDGQNPANLVVYPSKYVNRRSTSGLDTDQPPLLDECPSHLMDGGAKALRTACVAMGLTGTLTQVASATMFTAPKTFDPIAVEECAFERPCLERWEGHAVATSHTYGSKTTHPGSEPPYPLLRPGQPSCSGYH